MTDELGEIAAVEHFTATAADARRAARHWWDADADEYLNEHLTDLGEADFLWCPEGLRESDANLLGEVRGQRILELGCGNASASRWLAARGARPVGLDLSGSMLRHAIGSGMRTGLSVSLVQADACALPFADASFDAVASAFGAIAFVARPEVVMREVARVLRPGGRFVFSTNHPMRWVFPDSPDPQHLVVRSSYFDPDDYVEVDKANRPVYVETHRTMGQRVRDLLTAGLVLDDLIEPEWTPGREIVWGQWSGARGALVPGTVIFAAHKPASTLY